MTEAIRPLLRYSMHAMDRKAPIPSLRSQKPTWDKAAALAREWGLNQLAERLEKPAIGWAGT